MGLLSALIEEDLLKAASPVPLKEFWARFGKGVFWRTALKSPIKHFTASSATQSVATQTRFYFRITLELCESSFVSFFRSVTRSLIREKSMQWVCVICLFGLNASAQTTKSLIIPLGSSEGFSNAKGWLTAGELYQICYNRKNFIGAESPVLLIQEMAYRVDESFTSLDITIPKLEIWASTFTNEVSELSPIYHFNYGSDRKLLFASENVHLTANRDLTNPQNFQIRFKLQKPFLYDTARGHLLVDVNSKAPSLGQIGNVDGVFRDDDLVRRVQNVGEGAIYPAGDVMQLAYIPIPRLQITWYHPDHIELAFLRAPGVPYALEQARSLVPGNWIVATNFPAGTGGSVSVMVQVLSAEEYFRLRIEE